MSYDLTFWRETAGGSISMPALEIYQSLCRQKPVDGIDELHFEEVRDAFLAEFPDIEVTPNEFYGPMFSVLLYVRPIHGVFVTASWNMPKNQDIMDRLIRVGTERLAGVCYDPQRSRLFRKDMTG